ncbi:MAG: DivIVA domain-containing protein [Oscillospiraceae bacterium]|nr:DivIVA domain-containing protein [Oscillospiraceae bacterium]
MESGSITFANEANGYNKAQVDSYITKISEAYQATYKEYLNLNGKYERLLETRESAKEDGASGQESGIAVKTLMNTEILAQRILDDARAEAKEAAQRIINDAKTDAAMTAHRAKKSFELAQRTMEQAASEVERILTFHVA